MLTAALFIILAFPTFDQLLMRSKTVFYSIQQRGMFKIPMGSSLQDTQTVKFQPVVPDSVQQCTGDVDLINETKSGREFEKNNSNETNKSQFTSLQHFTLGKSSSQSSFAKELANKTPVQSPIAAFLQDNMEKQRSQAFKSRSVGQKFKKRKNKTELKHTVSSQKINNLKRTFIQKLKRNNVYRVPIETTIEPQAYCKIQEVQGIQIQENTGNLLVTLFILNFSVMLFIMSITIAIVDLRQEKILKIFEIIGIVISLLEIVLNLVTVRFSLGRKLQTLGEITRDYMNESLVVDFMSFIIMLLSSLTNSQVILLNICKVFILFKLPHWFQKIKKLQVFFIQNYYKEQYWSLVKVFLFNFIYAHILSIVLLCMADVNPQNNWIISKNLQHAMWYEKYVWSYYWSTTTMLTIGFGDITPSCYQEALIMIFIETISCVILAYNINCVGTLISNIRLQDQEKHKKLKIFKKLAEKNKVSEELNWKINNYIEQHSNIKKLTNIDQEAKFVQNLPPNYKVEYLKESNKSIFKGVYFFNSLMQKTLCALAESIKAKITHPLQVLLSSQTNFDLLILKDGQIGCQSSKYGNLSFSSILLNKVKITTEDRPFLLHTNFITKQRSNYKIISTVYSLLYYLNFQTLIATMREFKIDFELYCQLKDKCKYHIDEFQVFHCSSCNIRHAQFDCPKRHFIPFKQHIIYKEIAAQKALKNQRQKPFFRSKVVSEATYSKFYVYFKTQQQKSSSLISLRHMQSSTKKQEVDRIMQKHNSSLISNILRRKRNKTILENQAQLESTSYKKIQEKLTQTLKVHLGKLMGDQNYQDEIWLLESDKMVNFKMYFSRDNPQNLGQKFNLSKRKVIKDGSVVDWSQFREGTEMFFTQKYAIKECNFQSQKASMFGAFDSFVKY